MNKYLFLVLLTLISACYYDVEEELYPNEICDTQEVSYSGFVKPVLEDNCLICHNSGSNMGNVTLEGIDNVRIYSANGRLLGAIKHEPGFSPMPQGNEKLSDCQITKIEAWINQGTMDN
nr:hypothetical protein [Saprospiraceae bacterium]